MSERLTDEEMDRLLTCENCGTLGKLDGGYGGQHAVECPNCGERWVVD